ncbi:MAG: zinc-dependent peptidase [Saprospiraceae bacterium]|nr:zinc-dependent peptidase [Saprospiraceae bacterium]
MFANRIMLPFVLIAALFLVLAWTVDDKYSIYFVPFLVISALIFILSPQINWWWYSRNMPELSVELRAFLERSCGFYRRLSAAEQRRFRGRVALFNMGTDWEPLAFPEDSLPPDVQLAIAAQAVMLTFKREQFLFEKFEKVIIFPRPFPTPEHPYDHASEMHEADGCLLFSAEQVMLAFVKPSQWYNVAMHEYAKAFVLKYPEEPWPAFAEEAVWDKLEAVSGMPRAHVESVIGLAGVDGLPVAIHHFFVFPGRFATVFPDENRAFSQIFGLAV